MFLNSCETNTMGENNMQPIPAYQNYFFDDNKNVFGISEEGLTPVKFLDNSGQETEVNDFFSVNGKYYITVKSMQETEELDEEGSPVMEEISTYYEQSNNTIQEVQSIPARPVQGRKQLNNSEFTITDNEYKGTPVSDLRNLFMNSGIERFLLLNAYSYIQGVGLWIYVKEGREPVRPSESLYFWPVDKPSMQKMKEKGEIW